ncbi:TIGR03745 family integrating conjugative element membrane protein, partial [Pseudomonas sp. CrR25]|nr:TIGR03745 family integrating conjugative element membrane protein [Pseudomonas sp. CrR25]
MKPLARPLLPRPFAGLAALPLFGVLSPFAQAALP